MSDRYEIPQRIRLDLGGGRVISIIQGPGAYAGEGTVEAALVLGPGVGEPEGWLDADGLVKFIRKCQRQVKKAIEAEEKELLK